MPLIRVFDLGNVLLFVNAHLFYERVRTSCRPDLDLEAMVERLFELSRLDRGGEFAEVYEGLVQEAGLTLSFDDFARAWNDIFTPNPPMLEVVRQSPRPRYLLSNTNAPHVEWIREHHPEVFPLFDHCILSNEVGAHKPEAAIYRRVEAVTGEPPDRHVFVDDIPAFVEGARAVGWHAIRYVGVEDCVRRLAALEASGSAQ
jgi:HAD superfamily hydrolase (TIGR01509 family)